MSSDCDGIYKKLAPLLAKQLSVGEKQVTMDALIASDLGADSLDTAEIAMMIKDEFNYDLNEEEIASIKTVGDVVNILKEQQLDQKSCNEHKN